MTAAAKPDVLMVWKMLPSVGEALEESFTVHRMHEAPDKDAFLAEVGPRIRGAAATLESPAIARSVFSPPADHRRRPLSASTISRFPLGPPTLAPRASNFRS